VTGKKKKKATKRLGDSVALCSVRGSSLDDDFEFAMEQQLPRSQSTGVLDPTTVEALESIVYRSTRPKRARVSYGESERSEYVVQEDKPVICTLEVTEEQDDGADSSATSSTLSSTTLTNLHSLMDLILKSQHLVFFTGSGISKSAGLSTYRDDVDGIYEQIKRGERDDNNQFFDEDKIYLPTRTHMAIAKLMELNKAHFVITQNCDNLHLKSSVPWNKIIELHGNMYLLKCNQCNSIFEMDEVQQQPLFVHHREIKRKDRTNPVDRIMRDQTCFNCGKMNTLEHTITNFGEPIEQYRWDIAHEESEKADLMIVLGSSCAVSPANLLPVKAQRLVICNLNVTPLDHDANIVCHGVSSDEFMEQIFRHMGIEIPSYELEIVLEFGLEESSEVDEDTRDGRQCELKSNDSKSPYMLKIQNFDDMEKYVDRIVLAGDGEEIELNHENGFEHAFPQQESKPLSWSITVHLSSIGQVSEENRVINLGTGEELLPQKVDETMRYTLKCAIHSENPVFQGVRG